MNELKTLMSQQVDLLKNQIEEQNKSLKLSEKYTKQLIEQNELLIQENQVKSELILTLKEQIANIKLKKPSDVFLQTFESNMNQHLQMQLKKVLDQSNLQHTVNQFIQNKISPLQQQLSEQILKLSSLNTASNKGMNVDEKAIQQDTELRRINQQLGETDRKLNVIRNLLDHPKFAIRPKPSIEMTHYFKSIGYRSPTAKNIHSWSEKQHESFRKGDINQVAYYIGCKYNELSHFSRYEKGLNRDEIDIVQKNLRNDERIIDFMKKKGCHLNYDNRERLDRTFKLERYANESRLNDLVQKENTVQPIVQVKPEPKALDQDQDNGLTM